jgi:putative transposase
MAKPRTPWPHAPTHQLSMAGTYCVTAATYLKQHLFQSAAKLDHVHDTLLQTAADFGWQLEAWAVFSNHYHFVGHSPPDRSDARNLGTMLRVLHSRTASWVNHADAAPDRRVWYNYWDTRLTYEKSYRARLNYVHQNPVKHRLVAVANQYPWCSAAWFERIATPAQVATIYSFKIDRVSVIDDFEPVL